MIRFAKFAIFNILTSLSILLILEGASRVFQPVEFPDPLITNKRVHWVDRRQYDPNLFWTMRPYAIIRGQMLNGLGLRGPEIPTKDPGEFRIVSLGESTTFGLGICMKETYSSLLNEELAFVNGRRMQVINMGVPGYTLFQGITYLRLHGLILPPDAVLIYFGFNDFLPVTFRAARDAGSKLQNAGLTDRELFEQRKTILYQFAYTIQKYSNLARLISFHTSHTSENVILDSGQVRVPESDRRWILSELRNMSREHGFRLVVIIPWYRDFDEHVPLLRELTAWNDITVVDLPAKLIDLPNLRGSYFLDRVHPNPDGHRLIAEVIGGNCGQVGKLPTERMEVRSSNHLLNEVFAEMALD